MERPPEQGSLSWRLSSHPLTLLCFLAFRMSSIVVYLLGLFVTENYVLIFILTTLLLSLDFYTTKNIAGRRLVGLRWWNEVNASSGDTTMVFESLDPADRDAQSARGGGGVNATDRRFFWLAMYVQPVAWVGLAVVAVVKLHPIWLTLVVIALVLSITNTVAFSRCDKFGQASNMASSALYSGGIARSVASGIVSRFLSRG